MEASKTKQSELQPSDALPPGTPEEVKEAANGSLSGTEEEAMQKEMGALDFLLGATKPLTFDIKAEVDTPEGRRSLTFHVRQIDGKRLLELEDRYTEGTGPFAELDNISYDAAVITEATQYLTEPGGRQVKLTDEEFRGKIPDPTEALRVRFRYQSGILGQVAGQIRAVSGFSAGRVSPAEKAIERATGNS